MPIVGAATGGLDFSNYYAQLTGGKVTAAPRSPRREEAGAVLAWGNFLTIVINFVIIAWVLFLAVRGHQPVAAKEAEKPAEPAAPTKQEVLLTEIRDILAKKPA